MPVNSPIVYTVELSWPGIKSDKNPVKVVSRDNKQHTICVLFVVPAHDFDWILRTIRLNS